MTGTAKRRQQGEARISTRPAELSRKVAGRVEDPDDLHTMRAGHPIVDAVIGKFRKMLDPKAKRLWVSGAMGRTGVGHIRKLLTGTLDRGMEVERGLEIMLGDVSYLLRQVDLSVGKQTIARAHRWPAFLPAAA